MDITQAINYIIKRIDDMEKNIYIKMAEIVENSNSEDLNAPKRERKVKSAKPDELEQPQQEN